MAIKCQKCFSATPHTKGKVNYSSKMQSELCSLLDTMNFIFYLLLLFLRNTHYVEYVDMQLCKTDSISSYFTKLIRHHSILRFLTCILFKKMSFILK